MSECIAPADGIVILAVLNQTEGITGGELCKALVAAGFGNKESQRVIQRNLDRGKLKLGKGLRIYASADGGSGF